MYSWEIAKRESETVIGHLLETAKVIDEPDFKDRPVETLYGLSVPRKTLLKDIEKAARRIIKAVRNNEKIVIFGHDDVDGVTSTYLLFDYLTRIGCRSHYYYIPNRLTDHHGIKESFIDSVRRQNYSLVVTVDGGVSSPEGIEQLNKLGCDVIITDHHLIPNELPEAYAIVNPKRDDCPYPDKMLAGVGVVYFLVVLISEQLSISLPDKYLFWAAVGTIADKASMTGVNRIICSIVFDNWSRMVDRPLSLWSNYIDGSSSDYFEKTSYITNLIRLLSSGRSSKGENAALYFLLSPDYKQRELVSGLMANKSEYEKNLARVRDMLSQQLQSVEDYLCFYHDKDNNIPFELMGISGNYICNRFKVPAIIFKEKDNVITGEAKAPENFSLIAALKYCEDLLIQFGGHLKAAGFVVEPSKLEVFKARFREYVESRKEQIESGKVIKIDAEVEKDELKNLRKIVSIFSPYGEKAGLPVFLCRNINSFKEFPELANFLENKKAKNSASPEQFLFPLDIVFRYNFNGKIAIIDTGV